jgi:hypothetical protein
MVYTGQATKAIMTGVSRPDPGRPPHRAARSYRTTAHAAIAEHTRIAEPGTCLGENRHDATS